MYVWSCMNIVQYSKCTTYKYGMCSSTYSKSYANACLKNSSVFTQLQRGLLFQIFYCRGRANADPGLLELEGPWADFGRSVNPILTRGQIMPTTLLVPPSHFYTLLRPCCLLLLCGIEARSAPKILPWLHQVDFILWPTHNFSSAVNIPPRKQSNLSYEKAQMEWDISGSSVISCILAQK